MPLHSLLFVQLLLAFTRGFRVNPISYGVWHIKGTWGGGGGKFWRESGQKNWVGGGRTMVGGYRGRVKERKGGGGGGGVIECAEGAQ